LQNSPLGPDEIAVLTEAYEATLRKLGLVDRNDPITEIIGRPASGRQNSRSSWP